MKRVPTYSFVIPDTGEKIDIYFASEGLLRIETIGDDIRYYDISNNSKKDGGIEVTKPEVEFKGVPEETYMTIGKDDEMPPKPNITASVQGQMVPVTYTETTDDNLTTRTWTVERGGKTSGVQLFIERRKTDTAGNTPNGITTTKASDAINITTYKGQITLTGTKTGTLVGIYNTAGMLVKSMMSKGDKLYFDNLPSGVYIIKVGEEEPRKVQVIH
jgi:putative PPE-repeat protein